MNTIVAADKNVSYVKDILVLLKNYRTLTFCNSIEQTELLGKYNINSKNKKHNVFFIFFIQISFFFNIKLQQLFNNFPISSFI